MAAAGSALKAARSARSKNEEEKREERKEEENYKDKDDLFNPFKATAVNDVVVQATAKYAAQI